MKENKYKYINILKKLVLFEFLLFEFIFCDFLFRNFLFREFLLLVNFSKLTKLFNKYLFSKYKSIIYIIIYIIYYISRIYF